MTTSLHHPAVPGHTPAVAPRDEMATLTHYYAVCAAHPRLWDVEHAVRDLRATGATWQSAWLHVERAVAAIVDAGDYETVMRVLLHVAEWEAST